MHLYIHAYGNVVDRQESKKKKRERFTNKKNHITKKKDYSNKKKRRSTTTSQEIKTRASPLLLFLLTHYSTIYNILFLLPFFFCISVSDSYDDPSSFPFFSLSSSLVSYFVIIYMRTYVYALLFTATFIYRTSFVLLQFPIKFVSSKVSTAFHSLFLFSRTTARCVEQIRLTVRAKMENGKWKGENERKIREENT